MTQTLFIAGSSGGLLPNRYQAITWVKGDMSDRWTLLLSLLTLWTWDKMGYILQTSSFNVPDNMIVTVFHLM